MLVQAKKTSNVTHIPNRFSFKKTFKLSILNITCYRNNTPWLLLFSVNLILYHTLCFCTFLQFSLFHIRLLYSWYNGNVERFYRFWFFLHTVSMRHTAIVSVVFNFQHFLIVPSTIMAVSTGLSTLPDY